MVLAQAGVRVSLVGRNREKLEQTRDELGTAVCEHAGDLALSLADQANKLTGLIGSNAASDDQ